MRARRMNDLVRAVAIKNHCVMTGVECLDLFVAENSSVGYDSMDNKPQYMWTLSKELSGDEITLGHSGSYREARASPPQAVEKVVRIQVGCGLTGVAAASATLVRSDSVNSDPRYIPSIDQPVVLMEPHERDHDRTINGGLLRINIRQILCIPIFGESEGENKRGRRQYRKKLLGVLRAVNRRDG
jgi:hypothetical protein